MKVYVVTTGNYSDYGIEGIFSTEEKANEFMEALEDERDWNAIAEWDMDDAAGTKIKDGHSPWRVLILRDGTVEEAKIGNELDRYGIRESSEVWKRSKLPLWTRENPDIQDCLNVKCLAKSAEHAIKIASEKRAQFIASGHWD